MITLRHPFVGHAVLRCVQVLATFTKRPGSEQDAASTAARFAFSSSL